MHRRIREAVTERRMVVALRSAPPAVDEDPVEKAS
jgi:hypothetical protein